MDPTGAPRGRLAREGRSAASLASTLSRVVALVEEVAAHVVHETPCPSTFSRTGSGVQLDARGRQSVVIGGDLPVASRTADARRRTFWTV
jgi:hypothetical protein